MKKQQGFGLLEILLTLVLLGIGVAGLVALARGMLSASQEGGRYEIAMRLAESKFDEFRNFNEVRNATPPLTAFKDIATGSSSQTLSNHDYGVSWMVSNEYLNGGIWSTTKPATYLYDYPERKRIVVTVTWEDNRGDDRSLELAGAISPTGSFTSEETGDGLVKPREGPKVDYTPGAAPDVISVELGNGSKQETSKPSPTVSKNGKEVQFETMTYVPATTGYSQQIQQDFTTVSCVCNSSSRVDAYRPAQVYGTASNQFYWKVGTTQSKQAGIAANTGNNSQPTLCGSDNNNDMSKSSCCRDHYDGTGSDFLNYYAPLNTGRRPDLDNIKNGNGSYLDACRFVRLDGYYRPVPDWNLVKVIVTSKDFLTKPSNQASYQKYINYVVGAYIDWQKNTLRWPSGKTAEPPVIYNFEDWLSIGANASGGDVSTGVNLSSGTAQLIARGIYIDILDPTYLAGIDKNAIDYLAKVPLQDINLTMLAEWSMVPLSGNLRVSDYAEVANDPVKDIPDFTVDYYGKYNKGLLQINKPANGLTEDLKVKVSVYPGNSGVTATAVLPNDINKVMSAELKVNSKTTGGGGTTPPIEITVTGKIECVEKKSNNNSSPIPCGNNKVFTNVTPFPLTIEPSSACSINRPSNGSNQVVTYTCKANQGTPLTVTPKYSGTQTFNFTPQSVNLDMTTSTTSGPCFMMVEAGVTSTSPLTCSR